MLHSYHQKLGMKYALYNRLIGVLLGDSSGISTKAKSITSCDNAFVTNILLLLRCTNKTSVGPRPCSEADVLCAKAKRQQQMFYLRESVAAAANVLTVRKRSDSNNKAPSRNGNQFHFIVMCHINLYLFLCSHYKRI